jgi:hypothetical protein
MKNRLWLTLIIVLLVTFQGFSQSVIKGRVVDAENGEALEFATVFINNTTFGDITDQNGVFEIAIPSGNHELVISYLGYQTFTFPFNTASSWEFYEFRILPEPIELEESAVSEKRDRQWYRNLAVFKEKFLGYSVNADKCRIKNPEVLILDSETKPGFLIARSKDFLEIQNPNLGYVIRYVLMGFEYEMESGKVSFAGYPYFVSENIPPRKMRRIQKNRDRAYQGSITHLMRSLYQQTTEDEGFELFASDKMQDEANPESGKIMGSELIQKSEDNKVFLTYDKPLYVIYKNEKEEPNYKNLDAREGRAMLNLTGRASATGGYEEYLPQSSMVQMLGKAVQIFENGSYFHPLDIYLEGYMAWEKIADLMPFEYGMDN